VDSPAARSLPALAHMVVFVNCGIVPEQDKFVGMATVTKGHAGFVRRSWRMEANQLLVLPRKKIAIELISSEGTIASCKEGRFHQSLLSNLVSEDAELLL